MTRETPDLMSTDVTSGVIYEAYGSVPTSARHEAEELMNHLSDTASEDVDAARVKVKRDEDRPEEQASIGQGQIELSGAELRAEAAAPTATEVLRVVGRRLERKLARLARTGERDPSRPLQRRREDDPARPGFCHRAPERRTVVRRKTYSPLDHLSVEEALFRLDALDYRFFIFTDIADERTSIVYEDKEGVALRKVDGSKPDPGSMDTRIHVNEAEAPSITVADAVSLMNSSDMPFVFFRDTDRRRPGVLYRRYDGHYGLLVPSTSIV